MKQIEELTAYEIIEKCTIKDLNSVSYLLKHKKTGARIALLSNDDENKVFCVGFRTPPADSTGVAHILEHSVLCGSKNFPVKDPFVELVKGSLNTFLNAMTYPDKTIYPVASCNDKDFQNLMHVYLDAVFYPNIYKEEKIFCQEGWHYEMDTPEDELTINGVVYNEMKGAFSSADDVLEREIINSLYPDNTYGFESGGDPADIPKLSYEEFLDFHRRYYHPSNSYIYLYGNMDMAKKLEFLDEEYLSSYDFLEIDSTIKDQKPFNEIRRVVKEYAISEEESEKDNAYLAYNLSTGDSLDKKLYIAFQIIDYALCSAPGAPLKQELVDRGIGTDVYSIQDSGIKQPYFSIVAKNVDEKKEQEMVNTIKEVLTRIVTEGFDQKALQAGINYYEFKYREADFGSYPKGLMYGLQMLDSWLYDENKPFIHVEANATFAFLREQIGNGYFEKLIQTYFLDNKHAAMVVLLPKKGLTEKIEKELAKDLNEYKRSLSKEQLDEIVKATHDLTAYQERQDAPKDLLKIPLLSRADMKKEATGYVNELLDQDGTKILYHDLFTNGIGYMRLIFMVDQIPEEYVPYLGILKGTLGLLDTKNYTYRDLFNEINIVTGGMAAVNNVYGRNEAPDTYTATLELKTKFLYENMNKTLKLMQEIMLLTDYTGRKRIGEILAEGKSRMQSQMMSAGHSIAVNRALSYVSKVAAYNEQLSGMDFYRFVERLENNYDTKAKDLAEHLEELAKMIFRPENLMVDFTGSREAFEQLIKQLPDVKSKLYTEPVQKGTYDPALKRTNDGYKTAGQVQYVCRAGNFRQKGLFYHGSLKVLKVMMGYDYLWNQVRVQGGAYGCMSAFGKSGDCYFVSYRDPKLEKTIEVYEKAADYIENFDADERTMTQYIIGAISDMDTPMNPAAKALYSLSGYMTGLTEADLQRERDELLATTGEDIRRTADYIRAFMSDDCLCVVGNADRVEEEKELFGNVEALFS